MDAPRFYQAFQPGAQIVSWLGDVSLEQRSIGQLLLPSGRVVACDALVDPRAEPLGLEVAPGRYPVQIAIARTEDGDERIAAAMLRVSAQEPTRWYVAILRDQDPENLSEDEIGYGVDSGTASFMSIEAAQALMRRMESEPEYYDAIIAEMEKNYAHTRDWADIEVEPESGLNAILFSSGLGDGTYVSFWGLDKREEPVCLVTDFGLLDPDEEEL